MSRKAEPGSRRSQKRRPPPAVAQATSPREATPDREPADDSDFGLALTVGTALRRRPDA